MIINPIFLVDAYKTGHFQQYPPGTELVFSNFTPRKSRMPGVNHSVFFGLKYFLTRYLLKEFNTWFFSQPTNMTRIEYRKLMWQLLGEDMCSKHIEALRDLGYLPLAIYALPEGSVVPCGVPALVMHNTHPDFYWLPNMLETLMSCTLWQPCTSATIAREYRLLLDKYAAETSNMPEFVDYQAHDFSMRGMSSVESACVSGMAHLQYFTSGTYQAKNANEAQDIALNELHETEFPQLMTDFEQSDCQVYEVAEAEVNDQCGCPLSHD